MITADKDWFLKDFASLSNDELYDILTLRSRIFIVEQFCPYQDLDQSDKEVLHLFHKENEEILAYSRIVAPGVHYHEASIGRIITSPEARGKGLGVKLMNKSIETVEKNFVSSDIKIGAQCYLEGFYNKFGFKKEGDVYLEDGIPHYKMLRVNGTTL